MSVIIFQVVQKSIDLSRGVRLCHTRAQPQDNGGCFNPWFEQVAVNSNGYSCLETIPFRKQQP